jgi:hypothetical protein
MMDQAAAHGLVEAVQRYFDLMYDSDVSRFDQVFASTSQLHGLRDGRLAPLTAQAFRDMLASKPSPKAVGAPREEAILLVDHASDNQALVKVRVRIAATVYIDYLTYHHVDGAWLITSKGFHIEQS